LVTVKLETILGVGLIGVHTGIIEPSRRLFEGLLAYQPELLSAKVGLGLSYLVINKFEDATKIFQEVLEKEPKHPEARVFLALNKSLNGEGDDGIFDQLSKEIGPAAELAKNLLEALK
jgi:Tfp pilus assembly protein PilF